MVTCQPNRYSPNQSLLHLVCRSQSFSSCTPSNADASPPAAWPSEEGTMTLRCLPFLLLSLAALTAAGQDDEAAALLALKNALVDPLGALRDWNSPPGAPHCNWTGISCDAHGGVVALNLAGMNLSGVIPDDVANLTGLTELNIRSNAFDTELPPAITAGFPLLRWFDVSDNSFFGRFPSGLGECAALAYLNASGNNFVGPLPPDVGNATALETVDFRGGFFTGTIPASYGGLPKLKFLGLSGNNLTGSLPLELFQLTALEELIIGYNGFVGPIPPDIGNLTSIRYLDMAIGNLNGSIPPEIGRLKHLNTIFLYKNSLSGKIPKELGALSSLEMLDLSDNAIIGDIPAEIAQLSNLQLLNLMCNRLSGAIPDGISMLPKLEVLELWNNSLSGALPASLGKTQPLQWLDVSTNALSGPIPTGLCDGGNLTKLILFNNAFDGPIPAALTACASLVRVRVQNNQLNGSIPAGFGKMPQLQRLELSANEFSGDIPDDLSLSTSLSFIDVSHNRLESAVPTDILAVPTLQSFAAADNALTGSIPEGLGDCPALLLFDLSSNQLSGTIPASIDTCERLVQLNLQANRFTGPLPTALAMMPTLSILDLSNNFLTGNIPSNFGSSPALEMLNLAYNNLTGAVPSTGLFRTINPDNLAGNPGLCGGVLPPCGATTQGTSGETLSEFRKTHLKHAAVGWAVGILVILVITAAIFLGRRVYRKWRDGGSDCCDEESELEHGALPWRLTAFQRVNFTSVDVLACVKEGNIVGMGGTGVVYKADMPRHRTVVAVKKLWRAARNEQPGPPSDIPADELAGEVRLLGRLRHRNVVRMLGYISNDVDTMVLYEYMVNGSLWEALHGEKRGKMLMDWASRYEVAAGMAAGLAYLHHDCRPPVIHRDVKSSNVLLDANFEARIADFGLARVLPRKDETVSVVAGSYGYIAPEYGYTLKVDQKSDIYSFGVVLMELLTGKRPIEAEFGECQDIVGWVRESLRSGGAGVERVLDGGVGGRCEHVREEMLLVLRIAVLCTARSPKDRPTMRDVVTMLGEAKPRRKSSTASMAGAGVVKDKPVFTTSPDCGYL